MGKKSFYAMLPKPLRTGITFAIVCLAWVFFRAADLPSAIHFLGNLIGAGQAPEAGLLDGLIKATLLRSCVRGGDLLRVGHAAVVGYHPQTHLVKGRLVLHHSNCVVGDDVHTIIQPYSFTLFSKLCVP